MVYGDLGMWIELEVRDRSHRNKIKRKLEEVDMGGVIGVQDFRHNPHKLILDGSTGSLHKIPLIVSDEKSAALRDSHNIFGKKSSSSSSNDKQDSQCLKSPRYCVERKKSTFCFCFGEIKQKFRRKGNQNGDDCSSKEAWKGTSSPQQHMESRVFSPTWISVGEENKVVAMDHPAPPLPLEEPVTSPQEGEDGSQLWVRLGLVGEKLPLMASSVSLAVLNVDEEAEKLFIEKPEKPSPISILDPPFLDDVIAIEEHGIRDDQPPSKSSSSGDETSFEELSLVPITCMGDEEFKRVYIRSLLEASGLNRYKTWEEEIEEEEVLSESLYDELVKTTAVVAGEIPDDLKLLFDCVNEVLTDTIHRRSCFESSVSWVCANVIRHGTDMFPSMENLVEQVLKETNCDFDQELPRTLGQIVERDIAVGPWKSGVSHGIGDACIDVGDEMLEEMLEETVLELSPKIEVDITLRTSQDC